MTIFIGLDLGTTTIKAVAYNAETGRAGALAACPTPVRHDTDGRSEHDPEVLWRAAAGCLRSLAEQIHEQPPGGLAIASFAEAGLPLDAEMHPLYPIIAWYDRRTEPQAAWWEAQIGAETLHAITGQRASPSFGVTKWLWIREHHPEIAAQTARWLSASDYFMWRLTGAVVTDYSIASRTLLFDQQRLDWSSELLALTGLTPDHLPRPLPAGSLVGALTSSAAAETGLPVGLPCLLGGHDHLCAALAAGVHRPGSLVDSSGTAQAVLTVLPAFHTSPTAARGGFACYTHVAPDQYVLKAGMKMAGGAVEWLARLLAGAGETPPPYAALEQEAAPGVGQRAGPLWLPHLIGSGTPEGDRLSLAAVVGLRAEHQRGDLFRGLLESLALWLRHNVEAMIALTGQTPAEVTLLGGLTRLSLLSQIKADCLGLPVTAPELREAAAMGAALLAALGTDYYHEVASACASVHYDSAAFIPDPRRVAHYDRLYREVYARLYADLRAANRVLSDFSQSP